MEATDGTIGHRLFTDEHFVYNIALPFVFKYLNFKDIINCAQVCRLWQWLVDEDTLWRNLTVIACPQHVDTAIEQYGHKIRHVELCDSILIPEFKFRYYCKKLENLTSLALHGCHVNQLEIVSDCNKGVHKLYSVCWGVIDGDFLSKLQDLVELHLDIVALNDAVFLSRMEKLKHLSISSNYMHGDGFWHTISLLNIESLSLDNDTESTWISSLFENKFLLRNMKNLRKLQISNLPYLHEYDILHKIKTLPHLKELVLVNISISRAGTSNFGNILAECKYLDRLTISIKRVVFYHSLLDLALENSEILAGVSALKDTLKYFHWKMDTLGISIVEAAYNKRKLTVLKTIKNPNRMINRRGRVMQGFRPLTLTRLLDILKSRLPHSTVVLTDPEFDEEERRKRCCYECGKEVCVKNDGVKSFQ